MLKINFLRLDLSNFQKNNFSRPNFQFFGCFCGFLWKRTLKCARSINPKNFKCSYASDCIPNPILGITYMLFIGTIIWSLYLSRCFYLPIEGTYFLLYFCYYILIFLIRLLLVVFLLLLLLFLFCLQRINENKYNNTHHNTILPQDLFRFCV